MNSLPGSSYRPLNFHVIVETWYKVLDLHLSTVNWGLESFGNLRLPLSSHCSHWDLYPFKIFLNMTTCISYVSWRLLVLKSREQPTSSQIMREHWSSDFSWVEVVGWRGSTTAWDGGLTPAEVLCVYTFANVFRLDFISVAALVLNVPLSTKLCVYICVCVCVCVSSDKENKECMNCEMTSS